MRIAMIGTGYVGLVSGACFADFGHDVVCIDKDVGKIDALKNGIMPIWEPGLESLVKANTERGRLSFTTELGEGVDGAEAVFIAVGTPTRRGDGHADLTYVFDAVRELAHAHRKQCASNRENDQRGLSSRLVGNDTRQRSHQYDDDCCRGRKP